MSAVLSVTFIMLSHYIVGRELNSPPHPPNTNAPLPRKKEKHQSRIKFFLSLFFSHDYMPLSLKVLCWDCDESHQVAESLACPAADDMSVLSAEDFRCRGAPGATWGSQPPRW